MKDEKLTKALRSIRMEDEKKEELTHRLDRPLIPEIEKPRAMYGKAAAALAACFVLALAAFGLWELQGKLDKPSLPVATQRTDAALPTGQTETDAPAANQTEEEPSEFPSTENVPTGQIDAALPSAAAPNGETVLAPDPERPGNVGNLWSITDPEELSNIHWRKLVRGEAGTEPAKYPCPGPGTHAYSLGLGQALEKYAGRDDVTFYVRIDVLPEAGLPASPEAQRAYYDGVMGRLRETLSIDDVNFEVSTFEDKNTGEETVTFGAFVHTAAVFDAFPDLPDAGLFLSLYDENTAIK